MFRESPCTTINIYIYTDVGILHVPIFTFYVYTNELYTQATYQE